MSFPFLFRKLRFLMRSFWHIFYHQESLKFSCFWRIILRKNYSPYFKLSPWKISSKSDHFEILGFKGFKGFNLNFWNFRLNKLYSPYFKLSPCKISSKSDDFEILGFLGFLGSLIYFGFDLTRPLNSPISLYLYTLGP